MNTFAVTRNGYHSQRLGRYAQIKGMIVEFRKLGRDDHSSLFRNGEEVGRVTGFKFLGLDTDSMIGKSPAAPVYYLRKLPRGRKPAAKKRSW